MIRSIVFGCLTALIAAFIAHKASAAFLEAPHRMQVQLAWTDDAGSLQALLYSGLLKLAEKNPTLTTGGSALTRNGNQFRLQDSTHRFVCEAATLGRLAVESYRCDLLLPTPEIKSDGDSSSVATILFDALLELHTDYGNDLPQLSLRETESTRLVRLVDTESASRIACERTVSNGAVRCRVDIRP